jgi:hypothetical protein
MCTLQGYLSHKKVPPPQDHHTSLMSRGRIEERERERGWSGSQEFEVRVELTKTIL